MPKVLAETEEMLALDKPAGLIVHSDGRTEEPSVAEWLAKEYPALKGIGGAWVSPQGENIDLNGIVHRLDRTTSGVLLVAKTSEMYGYLKSEFKARRIEKTYRVYVHGHMENEKGIIVAEIMRSSESPRRWYARVCEKSDKRAAITEWELLEKLSDPATGEPASYVEARPRTGRTHQIRVHLAHIGHGIVADRLYAPECAPILGFTRPALHSHSISLTLPSGQKAEFTAPLPPDFPKS
ncbi:MAG: RluA family pseudouridine synthase [Patescibacteria group bacterium]|nr:RluA family pseudouridine synthase [Patescibacteria group bacterium]